MWKLIFAGSALAALIALPLPAAAVVWHAWCGVDLGRFNECTYDTREQCAAATQRLGGGGRIENFHPGGPAPRATDQPVRINKVHRHRAHHGTAAH
jgi:hypothetical protein